MDLVYSQAAHPAMEGRAYRNPRFFKAPEEGVTSVLVIGDWPNIVEAYREHLVPVEVLSSSGGVPAAQAATVVAQACELALPSEGGPVEIPEGWRDQPWPDLRTLARSFTDNAITTKADAVAAIEAELARRAAPPVE